MSDEDQQVSGVNWGWFAILASIIAIVGGATYFLLPSLISKTVTDITVVKAIEEPIKVKPLDPGGEAVDHQDLLVVDILKGGNKPDDQTETLRPTSPSPEPPPVAEAETAVKSVLETPLATSENQSKTDDKAMANHGDAAAKEPAKEIVKKPLPKAKPAPKPVTKDAAGKDATGADTKTAANNKPTKPAAVKPAATKADKDTTSKIKKRVIVIEGNEPLYMIQLAAFRNAEKATEMAKFCHRNTNRACKMSILKRCRLIPAVTVFSTELSAPRCRALMPIRFAAFCGGRVKIVSCGNTLRQARNSGVNPKTVNRI